MLVYCEYNYIAVLLDREQCLFNNSIREYVWSSDKSEIKILDSQIGYFLLGNDKQYSKCQWLTVNCIIKV